MTLIIRRYYFDEKAQFETFYLYCSELHNIKLHWMSKL